MHCPNPTYPDLVLDVSESIVAFKESSPHMTKSSPASIYAVLRDSQGVCSPFLNR